MRCVRWSGSPQYTITDLHALEAECLAVRAQGWSEDRQEFMLGVTCIAVPVYGMKGRAVGALVVSTKYPRLTTTQRNGLLQALQPAAQEFTAAIGGSAP